MQITLENVGKKYDKLWVFKGINSSFESGNIYGLIGFNGSGKSTLLQMISGFVTPNQGTITWTDENDKIPVENWSKSITMATPYMDLFEEFTVAESIELHLKFKSLVKTTDDLLNEIELTKHKHKMLSQLSSGMRQRLKLALAIYSDSSVLLLDEPCANLDKKWSEWYNHSLSLNQLNRLIIICSNSQEIEMKMINAHILNVSDFQSN